MQKTKDQRAFSKPIVILLCCAWLSLIACDDETQTLDPAELAGNAGQAGMMNGGELALAGMTMAGEIAAGSTMAGTMDAGTMNAGNMDAGTMAGTEGQMFCTPGSSTECISETEQSVCDESGFRYNTVACPQGLYCLQGQCGEQRCLPGSTRCQAEAPSSVFICDESGMNWLESEACEQGLACQNGACMSRCEAAAKLNTYIGCEYWTVDLDNYPDPYINPMPNVVPHSVVISNPGDRSAMVRFETRAGVTINPAQGVVEPGEVRAFTMPRLDVDNSGITNHSIKVSSSMPVIAYQFSPLNNENVFSNDASLLLPVNTFGKTYLVTSWPTGVNTENIVPGFDITPQAGYFTVVATAPGETEVTVTVSAPTVAGPSVPALEAGETATFVLSQYGVLNLQAEAFTPADFFELLGAQPYDLTGSLVESNQAVAVFGGHEEAVISTTDNTSDDTCCADHLEEQLLPVSVWTNEALCVKAKPRGSATEKDVWRVLSGSDNNVITTTPAITGLSGVTLQRGEWVQVETSESFKVQGTGALQASQFLLSQGQTDQGIGDPSMILTVPVQQYRDDYNILVPMGYGEDYVTIIRPVGLDILYDGLALSANFESFADGQWERAYLAVEPGAHRFQAAQAFGLVAYGWNNAVSYGYPAGLNLQGAER